MSHNQPKTRSFFRQLLCTKKFRTIATLATVAIGFGLLLILPRWTPPTLIIPTDTAITEPLTESVLLENLPVFRSGTYQQQASSHFGGAEDSSVPLLPWHNRDMNNFICLGIESKIHPIQIVPLRFKQSKCHESYVKGAVMARFEGPGTMVRLWMTLMSSLNKWPDQEVLRIYRDDEKTPILQAPLKKMFDGTLGELLKRPLGTEQQSYLAWYYPVDFSSKLIVSIDQVPSLQLVYYQVNAVLNRTESLGASNGTQGTEKILTNNEVSLNPDIPTQFQIPGPTTIERIQITFGKDDLETLKDIRLYVHWDDETGNSFELPLLDVFAAGQSLPTYQNGVLSGQTSAGKVTLSLDLPMPFERSADFSLLNSGNTPAKFHIRVLGKQEVPSRPFGKLRIERSESNSPHDSPFHQILTASGPGRLAGVCVQMSGFDNWISPFMYLEGDEYIIFDDYEVVGTGTEDYFNSSFYFSNGTESTPFAQWWGKQVQDERGEISACRWHLGLDTIDYKKSIQFKMEIGARTPEYLNRYVSTAYYYQ